MHVMLFGGIVGAAFYVAIEVRRNERWLEAIDLASMLDLADGQIDNPLREVLRELTKVGGSLALLDQLPINPSLKLKVWGREVPKE